MLRYESTLTILKLLLALCFSQTCFSQNLIASDFSLSEPYKHKNLTLYFLGLNGTAQNGTYAEQIIPLDEALSKNKVTVHETGNVSELRVENTSTDNIVFLQAGDIVKGGKQDRVLTTDMLLQPQSGRVAISAFCVERGRWQPRESESVKQFSSSKNSLSSKKLKIAAFSRKEQGEVWKEVSNVQKKLYDNIGADVQDNRSRTSLQLSLESDAVKGSLDDYIKELTRTLANHKNAHGYIALINGQINSADVFSSSELFKKQWPKLLLASATEALAELDKDSAGENNTISIDGQDLLSFLSTSEQGARSEKVGKNAGYSMVNDTRDTFFSESRMNQNASSWVHRTYLKK